MASLELYLDESGHAADKPFLVMGGYIAPTVNWIGFGDEWNSVLSAAGVLDADGNVGVFHMTDFEAKRGAFKGWTEDKRRVLLANLLSIIGRRKLHATGFALSIAWWNTIDWPREHPEHKPLESAYQHAMQNAVATALMLTRDERAAPELFSPDGLKCMFEQQGEYGGASEGYMRAISHFLALEGSPGVTLSYGNPRESPPLQAADIVAFEFRWRLTRPDLDRWPMRQILSSGRAMFAGLPRGVLTGANMGPVAPIEFPTQVLKAGAELTKTLLERG